MGIDRPRIGLLAPLSGVGGMYGQEICRAATVACDEINARGGILGQPIELIVADDGSLPATAVPAARRLLLAERCHVLIGTLLSNARIAVVQEAAEPLRVPMLNFSFYEGSIFSRYFFNFAALPNQQIAKMIPYMAERFGPKFFFAGSSYEWPLGSIDAAKRILAMHGGEVVGEEYVGLGSTDMKPLMDKVAKSGADVMVPYFAGSDQIAFLNEFAARGLKGRMAVAMGHFDEEMAGRMDPDVRAGFFATNSYFMTVASPANRAFLEHWQVGGQTDKGTAGAEAEPVVTHFGEAAWLCVHAFANAAEAAGSLEPERLVAALEHVRIDGPQGPVTMDAATHHAALHSYLARCDRRGRFNIVEAFGCTPPAIPERYAGRALETPAADRSELRQVGFREGRPPLPPLPPRPRVEGPIELSPERVGATASQILDLADVAILTTNQDAVIIQANAACCELFGYEMGELVGTSVSNLLPPRHRSHHEHTAREFLDGSERQLAMGQSREVPGYRKDGSEFPTKISVHKFLSPSGWIAVVTIRDLTARRRAEEQLYWQASHDQLTKLPNRALITERLGNALSRSRRHGHKIALLFVDLDHFKLINDSYGHVVGDQLLMEVSERLMSVVRAGDTVARFGGDEFVILCEMIKSDADAIHLAKRINAVLRPAFDIGTLQLVATASIGIAIGRGDSDSAESMLRNADGAMYAAKEGGRDGYILFDQPIRIRAQRELTLATELRTALDRKELHLAFQPIASARSGQVSGVETLLRWQSQSGNIPPSDFIPTAEKSGLIVPIGHWVLEQACQQQVRWDRAGLDPIYIAVNVSGRQFGAPDIVHDFARVAERTGLEPGRVVLEITETTLESDFDRALRIMRALGSIGFKFAIDDFGVGHSSLARLTRLPMTTIKIDRMFIGELEQDQRYRAIVSGIIRMSQAIGARVIAEGVETLGQRAILQDLGCDEIQGYLISRPVAATALQAMLERPVARAKKTG
jgi:diguanylate cyclase (GGDEF)-like protein/PAS domain S-box-containing protein